MVLFRTGNGQTGKPKIRWTRTAGHKENLGAIQGGEKYKEERGNSPRSSYALLLPGRENIPFAGTSGYLPVSLGVFWSALKGTPHEADAPCSGELETSWVESPCPFHKGRSRNGAQKSVNLLLMLIFIM